MKLTNTQLHQNTIHLAQRERELTAEVLKHLQEIDRRKLHNALGYSNLFEYCVKELKYSEGSAYRRISAMRALSAHPELENQIKQGELNLTVISKVQTEIKRQNLKPEAAKTLFQAVANKTLRETQQILGPPPLTQKLELPQETITKLKEIQKLYGTPKTLPELIDIAAEQWLTKLKQQKGLMPPRRRHATSAKPGQRVHITRHTQSEIRTNAKNQCEFISPITHQRCTQTHQLQIDHIQPLSQNGSNAAANLRLLCAPHNQYVYRET